MGFAPTPFVFGALAPGALQTLVEFERALLGALGDEDQLCERRVEDFLEAHPQAAVDRVTPPGGTDLDRLVEGAVQGDDQVSVVAACLPGISPDPAVQMGGRGGGVIACDVGAVVIV